MRIHHPVLPKIKYFSALVTLAGAVAFLGHNLFQPEILTNAAVGTDYTEDIQFIGNVNPTKCVFARNVWTMREFDGKIYVGHGNGNNESPCANAGPIPIITIAPATNRIKAEYTMNDEQASQFNVMDGKLYLPGDDSKEGWSLGNFYIKAPGQDWVKKRTVPGGVHVYALAKYDNKLWVGMSSSGSPRAGVSNVQYSEDDGDTWTIGTNNPAISPRIRAFVVAGGSLYASPDGGATYSGGQLRLSGCKITASGGTLTLPNTCGNTNLSSTSLSGPELVANRSYIIKENFDFGGRTVFSLRGRLDTSANYSNWTEPGGVYTATSFPTGVAKINLPNSNAKAIDAFTKDDALYILAHVKNTSDYTNIVYRTTNFTTVEEVLRFNYESYAMSFEKLTGQNEFFFGIGANSVAPVSTKTGDLLRISMNGVVLPSPNNSNADLIWLHRSSSFANPLTGTTQSLNHEASQFNPAFGSDITSYSLTVPYRFTTITLNPRQVAAAGATVTIASNVALGAAGSTTPVSVTVTAPDKVTTKTYTVNVTRLTADANNNLAALTITSGNTTYTPTPTFSASRIAYNIELPQNISSVNIYARANQSTLAPVSSPDITMTSSYDSTNSRVDNNGTVSNLVVGIPKVVRIVVTAESGAEKIYTITITRGTPTKTVPTTAQLNYTIPTGRTYNGSPQPIATPTPASGVTGLGAITIRYAGTSGTTYPETTAAPINAGSYTVYADIAEGTNYAAVKLILGTYIIEEALPSVVISGITNGATISSTANTKLITTASHISGISNIKIRVNNILVANCNNPKSNTCTVFVKGINTPTGNYQVEATATAKDFTINSTSLTFKR